MSLNVSYQNVKYEDKSHDMLGNLVTDIYHSSKSQYKQTFNSAQEINIYPVSIEQQELSTKVLKTLFICLIPNTLNQLAHQRRFLPHSISFLLLPIQLFWQSSRWKFQSTRARITRISA